MNVRVLNLPVPKTKQYFAYGAGDWTLKILQALASVKPDKQAAVIDCEAGAKETVCRIHSLAKRYGFRVVCRTMRDETVLVWVKKPGIDKHITDLWSQYAKNNQS